MEKLKVLHTADWHIGTFKSPVVNGVNQRSEDTKKCLDEIVKTAIQEKPDFTLISGDVFETGLIWSNRCCEEIVTAAVYINQLADHSGQVIVMRGTPNHDGAGQFDVLKQIFSDKANVHIVTEPKVLSFSGLDVAVLPGFAPGLFRAKNPGLSRKEENEFFNGEIANIILGLRAQCKQRCVLMAHYTLIGCDTESGQTTSMIGLEPVIEQSTLLAADFDLVALGHIHRPQQVTSNPWFYSGAINALNFNDEGQKRGFYIHEFNVPEDGPESTFHETPSRDFITLNMTDDEIETLNLGWDSTASMKWRLISMVSDKIVRVHYTCSGKNKLALNKALLTRRLVEAGAFMVDEIVEEKPKDLVNRAKVENTSPEENLKAYLHEKAIPHEEETALIELARPMIDKSSADMPAAVNTGVFEPVEISVKNYRSYENETFNFGDVSFCTVNGVNGAGKSSLFMDAIADCIYEKPRDGELTGWITNDPKVRSGSIMLTFKIGKKTYRICRTRQKSGKCVLNLAEQVDSEWVDRSSDKQAKTQEEIINLIGMDERTFKSCCLIMQDEYGVFAKSKPDERIEVLSTLLGLEIYKNLEATAAEKEKELLSDLKAVKLQASAADLKAKSYGDPSKALAELTKGLEDAKAQRDALTKQLNEKQMLLSQQEAARTRYIRLEKEIGTLEEKNRKAEQDIAAQKSLIASNELVISQSDEITEKVDAYHSLQKREEELSKSAEEYTAYSREVQILQSQADAEKKALQDLEQTERGKKEQLDALRPDEEAVKAAAGRVAEYESFKKLADEQSAKKNAFMLASAKASREHVKLEAVKKRMKLLENAGCIDIDNAKCTFLADALEAKKSLPDAEAAYAEATKEAEAIGYDETLLAEYLKKVQELSDAPKLLDALNDGLVKVKVLESELSALAARIADAKKNVSASAEKIAAAEKKVALLTKSYTEYKNAGVAKKELEPWLELQKKLLVAQERKANAEKQIESLEAAVKERIAEIAEKKKLLEEETFDGEKKAHLEQEISTLSAMIQTAASKLSELDQQMGVLKQQEQEMKEQEALAASLREECMEKADKASKLTILKTAFSRAGIPHQIIRGLIPVLTETANAILDQMIGGKMHVEFALEKLLKNGKEKETLDIIISDDEENTLPYESLSGGEKVKVSLSIILALAEIRALSAGVRPGMLGIDEATFLDADGMQAYFDALEAIHGRYGDIKVIAITHDESVKARFFQSVTVYKDEHGSHVKWDRV